MTRAQYEAKVAQIVRRIHAGELYQANLTRKFYGSFTDIPGSFALFERLCAASPAPYSAYIKAGDSAILSSSPERFLRIEPDGSVTTRPIKGSIGRSADASADAAAKQALAKSAKDRAENLMIVDLMRNDLARISIPGSVQVDGLFEITSHPHVHHMASTVSAHKEPHIPPLDVIKACFPPGSMTGAPKIRAIRLCTELERLERGVYSGALGWLGGDGSADLSVVIRTLILQGRRFEFQVGGGIVADSTPEGEWRETIVKARGIAGALGIPVERLEAL
jgi:para-aminobenzoate synthetase component 1